MYYNAKSKNNDKGQQTYASQRFALTSRIGLLEGSGVSQFHVPPRSTA